MGKISGLSEEFLEKILSFLPTKEAVSTSILSKQWEFLWMWAPKLDFDVADFESELAFREFINKNLPSHRAPVIERFSLRCRGKSVQLEDIKLWAGIAVSRCVSELSINCDTYVRGPDVIFPSSLYTCKTLETLMLDGKNVLVDVPLEVSLPSLKTLELRGVTYSNEDSLRLLLSCCPVLEDLVIERDQDDNLTALVVTAPSLHRLSLQIGGECPHGEYVIVTPSLRYFKVHDERCFFSYLIEHMPKLEEADIMVEQNVEELLESITSVKRLSLSALFNSEEESLYPVGIVFSQLEQLKLRIDDCQWPKLLFRLLEDSPKLRDLKIYATCDQYGEYLPFSWDKASVPKCLLESLESFKFEGYQRTPEEKDLLSFLFINARRLKSKSIIQL